MNPISHFTNKTKLGSIFMSSGSQKDLNLLPSPQRCSADPISPSLRIQPQDIGPKELVPEPHLYSGLTSSPREGGKNGKNDFGKISWKK